MRFYTGVVKFEGSTMYIYVCSLLLHTLMSRCATGGDCECM